jgi:putative hydrolase of the HAD superfamily
MKIILWDFDGTIADRPAMWTESVYNALRTVCPEKCLTSEQLRPYLAKGFPWHSPGNDYRCRRNASIWWENLRIDVFAPIFRSCMLNDRECANALEMIRNSIISAKNYRIFPDVTQALESFRDAGWSQAILSNNFPELPSLVEELGIGSYFFTIFTSASIGYEKPNPAIYSFVKRNIEPAQQIWVIGDNYICDYEAPRNAGLNSVLVRKPDSRCKHFAEDLLASYHLVCAAQLP